MLKPFFNPFSEGKQVVAHNVFTSPFHPYHGGGDSAGPGTPTTPAPPPPLGAFGQQLVAKGVALRPPWAPKVPDAT